MQTLIGGIVGLLVGAGVWLLAQRLVSHYGAQLDEQPLTERQRVLFEPRGAVSLAAALTLAGIATWGAYVGWRISGWQQVAAVLLVTGLLVTVSLVDFQTRRIPNSLVLALFGWAVVQVIWLGQPTPVEAGLGLALAGGMFLVIALIGRGALGSGDVKLAAALGAVLGFPLALSGLLLGVVLGGVAALVLLITRRVGRKDPIAYGPYLALGAWIVWTRALGLWLF
jgi:prepilin signal peptidase PulO-like enzyme (type II secretory pathway)